MPDYLVHQPGGDSVGTGPEQSEVTQNPSITVCCLPGEPSRQKLARPDNTALSPIITCVNTSADYPPGKGRGRASAAICVCLPAPSHKNVLSVQPARKLRSSKGVGKLFRGAALCHPECCQTVLLMLPNCFVCLEVLELQQKGRRGGGEKLRPFLC